MTGLSMHGDGERASSALACMSTAREPLRPSVSASTTTNGTLRAASDSAHAMPEGPEPTITTSTDAGSEEDMAGDGWWEEE